MSYPEVIALIDTELDRLHSVRALLFSPDEFHTSRKGKADLLQALEQETDTPVAEVVARVIPEPRLIAPKQRRERRTAPSRGREATALSRPTASGPVYVSAAAVRSKEASRETESIKPQESLTPEMLSRRWFHSAGS